MTHRVAHILACFGAVTCLAALIHCSEAPDASESGARCSLNSDCKSPLVCGFERCRAQCQSSRDCGGKICVRGQNGANVCQLDDEVQCTHNSQCAGTQLCGRDGHCRDACVTDKDCVTDLVCTSRVCAKREELVAGELPGPATSEAGVACTYATDCPGNLVCLYGRCDVECLGDKDCLVGWTCSLVQGGGDGRCRPASLDASVVDGTTTGNDAGDATDTGPSVKALSVGGGLDFTCALFDNGKVKCAGGNGNGQLGLGDTASRGDGPNEMGSALPFVNVGTGRTVKALSVGQQHVCTILDDDKVKCWGWNAFGQLGLGDAISRGTLAGQMGDALPYVDLGTGRTAKSIVASSQHTCALLDDNQLKCWGRGDFGQLGQGDASNRGDLAGQMGDALPAINLGTGRTVKAIYPFVESGHSCALLDNDELKCWGLNNRGQLGLGDFVNRGTSAGQMGDALPPIPLGTGRFAKSFAAGWQHTCAVLDDDTLKCWGQNDAGQLGQGDAVGRGFAGGQLGDALPPVSVGTGRTVRKVSAGTQHTCVVLDNDRAKCWGVSANGQLGLGSTMSIGDNGGEMGDSLPFVALGADRTVKAVAAGALHTCAILDSSMVKCWGRNTLGALGLGDVADRGAVQNEMGDNLPIVQWLGP